MKFKYVVLTYEFSLMALINRYAMYKKKDYHSLWYLVSTPNTMIEGINLGIRLQMATLKCAIHLCQDKNIFYINLLLI